MQLLRDKRLDECIQCLENVVEANPNDARAYSILGAAHAQMGDLDSATQAFQRALDIEPSPRAHFNLGMAFQDAGRPQDAIAQFEFAVQLDPQYKPASEAVARLKTETPPGSPATEPTVAVEPADPGYVPPQVLAAQQRLEAQKAHVEEDARHSQKETAKAGLIYGMIVGPLGFMGASFVMRLFVSSAGGIIGVIVEGLILGGLVGLWIGLLHGDEMDGLKAGAVLGLVFSVILGLFQLHEFGLVVFFVQAIFGMGTGAIAGFVIGMIVTQSIYMH